MGCTTSSVASAPAGVVVEGEVVLEAEVDRANEFAGGASSTKWFEDLFGFREGGSYRENRAHFRM